MAACPAGRCRSSPKAPRTRRCCPGPDRSRSTLEWGAPLTFTPGRASFVLPAPPAGTVRATIDLPGDQADVHLSAGLITRRSTVDGRTIVEATLRSGVQTEVWWSMRDSAPIAAAREVRTARRRADARDARRFGRPDGGARRRHRRAGRAAHDRRPAAGGLRADEHFRQLARIERPARRQRDADARRSRGAPSPVPRQPRTPARRRIVHVRHRVSEPAGGAARAGRGRHRRRRHARADGHGARACTASTSASSTGAAVARAAADAVGVPVPAQRRRRRRAERRREAIRRRRRARRRRRPGRRRRRSSRPKGGRSPKSAARSEPRAAVPEGHAAGRRDDRVGGSGGRTGEAGARRRRDARAAAASRLQAERRLHRLVRVPARRHAVRAARATCR